MDDNESSIDKNSLYHEPFNVNMYTSAASACSMNDLQRQHVTPDYTGELMQQDGDGDGAGDGDGWVLSAGDWCIAPVPLLLLPRAINSAHSMIQTSAMAAAPAPAPAPATAARGCWCRS